jgi:DNA repair protein RadC
LPSANDVALTRQLHAGAKLLGIRVLDHLVLGDATFASMQQRGEIPFD